MFIRSENLFFRPAWPEDSAVLSRLEVPAHHNPLKDSDDRGLVIMMPGSRASRLIGTAGIFALGGQWQARIWLASAWRNLGLHDEAEESLAQLIEHLPPPEGRLYVPRVALAAA